MADSLNFDSWLNQLECPQYYTTEYVKQALHKGVLGLLWDDIPRTVRPVSEVSEIRKNILLYKLKNEPKDTLIQSVRNTVYLRKERKKLNDKINSALEKWNKQEFLCRQKVNLLEKKKAERKALEIKKEILKIKNEQMLMQIKNCSKMQEICRHLMPPSIEEISETIINDCLTLASNYSGGPEKRKVWNTISELLSPIKVPVLWNALMTVRTQCTDFLIHLDIDEDKKEENKTGINLDIGTAQISSEHLHNISKQFLHKERTKKNEMITMEYVEKIEHIIEKHRSDLSDWLPLTLEVRKLEVLRAELQKELANLEEQLPIDDMMVEDVLIKLVTDIKAVDNKIVDCVQEIQDAFGILKSSELLITKTKESLLIELEKFYLLQNNEENQWTNIDLSTELICFNNNINVNALRKIMLKGETGVYKYLQTCFNRAFLIVDTPKTENTSNFPMIRVPLYYLIDLYKMYIMNSIIDKQLNESLDVYEDSSDFIHDSSNISTFSNQNLIELLRMINMICKKTVQHSEEFEKILKTWSTQAVREIVSKIYCKKTVNNATLDEWEKLFFRIIYVLQKSNINIA